MKMNLILETPSHSKIQHFIVIKMTVFKEIAKIFFRISTKLSVS